MKEFNVQRYLILQEALQGKDFIWVLDMLAKRPAAILILLALIFSSSTLHALESLLNPNTATSEQLQQLPFVGATKAKALIKCREQKVQFLTFEDIKQCPEIGQSTFEAIKPYLTLSNQATKLPPKYQDSTPLKAANHRFVTRITTRPGEIKILPDSAYYDTLLNFIHYAEDQINITIFIFKTTSSPKNKPSKLIEALGQAQKRGVNVTVLLEHSNYDENLNLENQKTAKLLRKKGIKVRFDSPKATTHSKLVIVDNRYCFVGSHNFTHSALKYNNELSLLIDNTDLAKELQEYIKEIK